MASLDLLIQFKQQHDTVRAALTTAENAASHAATMAALLPIQSLVDEHLRAKENFYAELETLCRTRNDATGVNLTAIFRTNMTVLGGAVQKFFRDLATMKDEAVLKNALRTVSHVLRSRFDTEEKAVFPIYQRQFAPAATRTVSATSRNA
jgi:hypothetical protein